jgi:uncharacterized protein YfaS (alpha-2-macroglobulin family)
MLDKAIARLAGMQAPNGGFSLWGNLAEYQYWLSAYISNFLLDAREQGFDVPPEVEKRALEFLLKGLQEGDRRPADRTAVTTTRTRSGTTTVTPDPAASRCSPTAPTCSPARARRRWRRCASCTSHRLPRYSGLALVQLGLALKLMGDEDACQERDRSRHRQAARRPRAMPGGATTAAICATGR